MPIGELMPDAAGIPEEQRPTSPPAKSLLKGAATGGYPRRVSPVEVPSGHVLEVRDLTIRFGRALVFSRLTFAVPERSARRLNQLGQREEATGHLTLCPMTISTGSGR
jgi:hypothetical protein